MLIVIVVIVLFIAGSMAMSAILYGIVSNQIQGPAATKPIVVFGSPAVTATMVSFQVAGATPIVSIGSYRFNLQVNGVLGTAETLRAGNQTISVGPTTFFVRYTDVSGSGTLKQGDSIAVGLSSGGNLPAGEYAFFLIWGADGSSFPAVTWQV